MRGNFSALTTSDMLTLAPLTPSLLQLTPAPPSSLPSPSSSSSLLSLPVYSSELAPISHSLPPKIVLNINVTSLLGHVWSHHKWYLWSQCSPIYNIPQSELLASWSEFRKYFTLGGCLVLKCQYTQSSYNNRKYFTLGGYYGPQRSIHTIKLQ